MYIYRTISGYMTLDREIIYRLIHYRLITAFWNIKSDTVQTRTKISKVYTALTATLWDGHRRYRPISDYLPDYSECPGFKCWDRLSWGSSYSSRPFTRKSETSATNYQTNAFFHILFLHYSLLILPIRAIQHGSLTVFLNNHESTNTQSSMLDESSDVL